MPRSNVTRGGAPDFSPEVRDAPNLGVYAPLNVQAAPSGAEALARALGLVSDVAQPVLDDRAEQGGFDRTRAGMSDASLNTVDAKRRAEDQLYDRGVKHVVVEKQAIDFLQQWEVRYDTELDKNASEEAIARDFDEQAKAALGQFLSDEEAKRILAPKLLAFISKKTGEHRARQAAEFRNEAVNTVTASVMSDIDILGATDFEAQVQKIAPMIGRTAANKLVVDAIIERAVSKADESILDNIPKSFRKPDGSVIAGPASTYAEAINTARLQARAERKRLDTEAMQGAKGTLELGFVDRINAKRWLTKRELQEQQKAGLLTESEVVSWYSRSEAARLADLTRADAENTAAMTGVPLRFIFGDANVSEKEANQILQARVDRRTQENGGNMLAAAIEVATTEGYADPRVVEALAHTPLNPDAEGGVTAYQRAADMYAALPNDLRMKFVPNRDKRVEYEMFNRMVRSGASPKAALQTLQEYDSEIARANREMHATQTAKLQAETGSLEVASTGWVSSVKVDELANAPQVRFQINDRMNLYVSRGMLPEEAQKAALEEIVGGSMFVQTSDGKHLLVPRSGREPAKFAEALNYAYTKLPEYLAAAGVKLKPEDVRFSYDPTSDGSRMILVDKRGIPVGSKSYSLDELVARYIAASNAEAHKARQEFHRRDQERRAEFRKQVNERAKLGLPAAGASGRMY